jgi:uncharacterized protein YdiU (UPF0061 family)
VESGAIKYQRFRGFLLTLCWAQASQTQNPDIMQREPAAITCRVAPSFLRIGHVELFGRRARKSAAKSAAHSELEQIVRHALFREYPELHAEAEAGGALQPLILRMLAECQQRLVALTAVSCSWHQLVAVPVAVPVAPSPMRS